jgi:hypothetical protein
MSICERCGDEIDKEDLVTIYGNMWLPGKVNTDVVIYYHTSCLGPECFHAAQKALGNL